MHAPPESLPLRHLRELGFRTNQHVFHTLEKKNSLAQLLLSQNRTDTLISVSTYCNLMASLAQSKPDKLLLYVQYPRALGEHYR